MAKKRTKGQKKKGKFEFPPNPTFSKYMKDWKNKSPKKQGLPK